MGPRLTLLTPPAEGDDADGYYVASTTDVIALLQSVVAARMRAAAYFDQGRHFIHTSLLAVLPEQGLLIFEQGPDSTLNQGLTGDTEVTFVTADRGVPLQFTCEEPMLTRYEGADAFSAALPPRILRLQRRNDFRLYVKYPVKCGLVRGDHDTGKVLSPTLVDLSCGGAGLTLPADLPLLAPGSRHRCSIELPLQGRIDTMIEVHGITEHTRGDGVAVRRYGMEFLGLDANSSARIQRYIADQERASRPRR